MKIVDDAHHRWQKTYYTIPRKTTTNEEARVRTVQQSVDDILRERRFCWLGHVIQMDHQRIPQQVLYWEVPEYKRGPGWPQTNWRNTINKDLQKTSLTRDETEVAALNRQEWR